MKRRAIYIHGLFEKKESPLFVFLKKSLERAGIECCDIELYAEREFGAYSFTEELQRVQKIISSFNPDIAIAHSLGAYVLMQVHVDCPFVLLDPSRSISDIISDTVRREDKTYYYDDGHTRRSLSSEFVQSMRTLPAIETLARHTGLRDIYIFGAGRGGHRVAEQYAKSFPGSAYVLLPDAEHEFSSENDKIKIIEAIKKRLDVMSSREEGVHTRSW